MVRYKIQSKEDPKKTKYITSEFYSVGDTITLKWHKEWTVIDIIDLGRSKTHRSMAN